MIRPSKAALQARRRLKAAQARHEFIRAKLAEMELAEKKAGLVSRREAEAAWQVIMPRCKARLLRIAPDLKARLPQLTDEQVKLIDGLVHEAVEDLGRPVSFETRRRRP